MPGRPSVVSTTSSPRRSAIRSASCSPTTCAIVYQKLLPTLHENIPRIPAIEILLNTPIVQKYILEGREGELLEIIKKSRKRACSTSPASLVELVETEYIHHKVALEATPKPEELKMRLKGIS